MAELARTMPGYISHKGFFADDGERITIVEFEHEEGLPAWRRNPEHVAAQKLAREKYYTEYHVQVCTLDRESQFKADEAAVPAAPSYVDRNLSCSEQQQKFHAKWLPRTQIRAY